MQRSAPMLTSNISLPRSWTHHERIHIYLFQKHSFRLSYSMNPRIYELSKVNNRLPRITFSFYYLSFWSAYMLYFSIRALWFSLLSLVIVHIVRYNGLPFVSCPLFTQSTSSSHYQRTSFIIRRPSVALHSSSSVECYCWIRLDLYT